MDRMNRRRFLQTGAAASLSFIGLQKYLLAAPESTLPYGPLISDPDGILDLPKNFEYQVISKTGDIMDDGLRVPGAPDGMAAFPGKDGKTILVRNHELSYGVPQFSALAHGAKPEPDMLDLAHATENGIPCAGGTTNVVYNTKTKKLEKQFLSLVGTDRNCAGGAMPWGSWITCEEPGGLTNSRGRQHGYCFEVKATDDGKLQKAVPLKALGRYRHEAVALDPKTGILYLTEDMNDGLLYRFIPNKKNDFTDGKLQALAVVGRKSADLRNYKQSPHNLDQGKTLRAKWINVDDIDSPKDDLRYRGHKQGAARFARGEGIIYTDGALYICCTDGGPDRKGQVFKLTPSGSYTRPDKLELFLQPSHTDLLTNGDNLCSAPWGDLVICEDLCSPNKDSVPHVRGVTPDGKIYNIARNGKNRSEFAGSCFSADGTTLFVNMQGLGLTLAITGPWQGE